MKRAATPPARAVAAFVALLALAGCGVPTGGEPEVIPATKVPFGLASPTPSAQDTGAATPVASSPKVYFLRQDDSLAGSGRELPPGDTPVQKLTALLVQLAAGPTDRERAKGLSSALPPTITLSVVSLSHGVATIALGGEGDAPNGDASRREVGQLVLTATSLPGVDAVLLSRDGQPADALLPSGALTTEPLSAADYTVLTTPSPAASPQISNGPASP